MTSLIRELNSANDSAIDPHTFNDYEKCFAQLRRDNAYHITMLRSPRAHVLSQYLECCFDQWGRETTANTGIACETDGGQFSSHAFASWVSHFADEWTTERGDFNCCAQAHARRIEKPWLHAHSCMVSPLALPPWQTTRGTCKREC